MKKLLYILISAAIIAGCSKEETIQEQLIGTWELQYYYADVDNNPIDLSMAETYPKFDHSGCVYLTFNKDKNCGLIEENCSFDTPESKQCSYTYSVDDLTIYKEYDCENDWGFSGPEHACSIGYTSSMLYKINDGVLIIGFESITGLAISSGVYYPVACIHYGYYTRK